MRDIERIDRILSLLKELWLEHPDLRLNQLLSYLLYKKYPSGDFFYVEDEFLEKKLKEILNAE